MKLISSSTGVFVYFFIIISLKSSLAFHGTKHKLSNLNNFNNFNFFLIQN
jgi:hypothetical protein